MQYFLAGLIGIVSGITSGLFGVGGGIVMVPAMVILLGLDIKIAVGTSLAVIIPTAASGVFKHWLQNNVDWKIGLSLAPTAIVGAYLGAWLTSGIPSPHLKRAFGGFLLLVGLKLLMGR